MKSRNDKPKKKLETNIGKIIYGFLLFMPLIAIAVTCAYVIFNKNAYHSYYGETINETNNEYIDYDDMEQNHTYYVQTSLISTNVGNVGNITFNISYAKNLSSGFEYPNDTYNRLRFFRNDNKIYIQFMRIDDGTSITYTDPATIQFTYQSIYGSVGTIVDYLDFYEIVANPSTYLDNAFYYGIYNVEQSSLFNWAKNSLIYTGMNSTANALSINNTFIPMLLTYWLIISVFYYLYDIILIILNVFHRKIHELEESI